MNIGIYDVPYKLIIDRDELRTILAALHCFRDDEDRECDANLIVELIQSIQENPNLVGV